MSRPWLPHQPTGPQPETCELCGRLVSGAELMESNAEGLEGLKICSNNPACAQFRSGLSATQKRSHLATTVIGESRVYPAGGPLPWEEAE